MRANTLNTVSLSPRSGRWEPAPAPNHPRWPRFSRTFGFTSHLLAGAGETRTPASCRQHLKACEVNWLPWSVSNAPVGPNCSSTASTASKQNRHSGPRLGWRQPQPQLHRPWLQHAAPNPHYLVLHESGPCVSCVRSLRSGCAARADRVSRCRPPERRERGRPRGGNRSAPGDRNPLARSSRRSQRGRRARRSPVGHRRGDCRAPPASRGLRRGSPARGRDGAARRDFPRRSRRNVRIAVTPRNHHQIFLDNRVKLARLVYVSNRVVCSWASGEPSRPTPGWPRGHRCNPTAPRSGRGPAPERARPAGRGQELHRGLWPEGRLARAMDRVRARVLVRLAGAERA